MHLTSSSIRPKKRLPTRKNAQVPALISLKGDVVPPHSEGNPNIVPNVQSRLGTQRSTRSSHIRNPQPQPLREPHLECSTPLQANGVSNKTLFDHVAMLRTEPVLRVARPILQRIMAHNLNRGLFNEPVDAVALGLPDYHRIVKRPMDFGTMKDQLYALHYERLEQFIADVRLVLSNAMVYNPSTNQVHINARQLLEEFEDELGKLGKKISRDTKRRAQHNCGVCQGRTCRLCGEKCLKLDPVMLICSGPCALRIKRGAPYFMMRDGSRIWCQRCHMGLSTVLSPSPSETEDDGDPHVSQEHSNQLCYKRDLLKRGYDEDISESWIQCSSCSEFVHQACGLFNPFTCPAQERNLRVKQAGFVCPLCRLTPGETGLLPPVWLDDNDPETFACRPEPPASVLQITDISTESSSTSSLSLEVLSSSGESVGGDTTEEASSWDGSEAEEPRELDTIHSAEINPMDSMEDRRWDARSLPVCHMAQFIESKVHARLIELGHEDMAESVMIRVASSVSREWNVPLPVRKYFKHADGSDVQENLTYGSKAILMFQNCGGIDICIFSMYVQEYGSSAPVSNHGHVYISYLDSVEYFRPRTARTAVYHEILVSYFGWVRKRGFHTAHLWACPPQRGNNFIFWCHPQHQRTPSKDRLLAWYRAMLNQAHAQGVVCRVDNFEDEYLTVPSTSKAVPCPPLLEGDYWIDEAVRLYALRQRRKVTLGESASVLQQCEGLLRSLRLHPSARAFNQPVDPEALNIPDYRIVITQPMDLGTIEDKLRQGQYMTVRDMLNDMMLVVANARRYNPPKHPVHVAAKTLETVFDREWNNMQSRWQMQCECAGGGEAEMPEDMGSARLRQTPATSSGEASGVATSPRSSSTASPSTKEDSHNHAQKRLRTVSVDGSVGDGELYSSSHDHDSDSDDSWSGKGGAVVALEPSPTGSCVQSTFDTSRPLSRANWLMRDLRKSVHKLKEDILVFHLQPEEVECLAERQRGLEQWSKYTSGSQELVCDLSDPDVETMSRPLLDGRHTMLEISMFRHLQFDTLRRAKHSTSMLLYYLHFPQRSFCAYCSNCSSQLQNLRWHCATCANFDICHECAYGRIGHPHALTPYQVSDTTSS